MPGKRFLVPRGLALDGMYKHMLDLSNFIKKQVLPIGQKFDECWTVCGSGQMTRILQDADIADKYIAVGVSGYVFGSDICGKASPLIITKLLM